MGIYSLAICFSPNWKIFHCIE